MMDTANELKVDIRGCFPVEKFDVCHFSTTKNDPVVREENSELHDSEEAKDHFLFFV